MGDKDKHNHCKEQKNEDCKNSCNGCICDQLRKLQRKTEVDVFLSSGQVLEDVLFIKLNQKDCCAFFRDPNPPEAGSTLIVDCQRIDAIRIEAD
jgi:hypothetical protein